VAKRPKIRSTSTRYDWGPIRTAREVGGKDYTALAAEYGPNRNTIAARAKREGWLDPAEIQRKASADVARKGYARLIAQEAQAVFANRKKHAQISDEILEWVKKRVREIANGDPSPLLDVDLVMRRLSLILSTLEGADSRLAGLDKASNDWRSDAGGGGEDTRASSDRVLEALRRLTGQRKSARR